jgi:CRP-like cAMP-binding protein
MDARPLKEKALQLFQKGKFAKAAEVWVQICKADPKDNQSRLRLGDALAKAGQSEKAFEAYRTAAEGFVKAGFLPQATAAAKLALGLKPAAIDVQLLLSGVHAERFGRPSPLPSSLSSAPEGPQPPFESSPSRARPPTGPLRVPGPPPFVSSASAAQRASAPVAIEPEPEFQEPEPEFEFGSGFAEGPTVEPVSELEGYIDEALGLAASPPSAEPLVGETTGSSIPRPVRKPPFRFIRSPEGLGAVAQEPSGPQPQVLMPPPPPPPSSPEPAPGEAVEPGVPISFELPVDAEPLEAEVLPAEPLEALSADAAPLMMDPPQVAEPFAPSLELERAPNPDATMLGNVALMEQLRRASAVQDMTVVAMNPLALGPPPATGVAHPQFDPQLDEAMASPAVVAGAGHETFPRVPLFDGLGPEAFLALVKECPLREYSIHEVVLEQGRPGDSFFVILAGRVRVFREEGSARRELAILEAGAFFGELALLTGAPRSAWVVAEVEDTRLLEVSAGVVRRLSVEHPSVAEGLASLARKRILSNVMMSEPLFAGLKRNERLALAELFEAREAASGEVLLAQGATPPGLLVVVSGQLRRATRDGTTRLYPSGTLVGDLETLQGVVTETVAVHRPGLILTLPAEEVSRLLAHPTLAGKQATLLEAARRRLGG